MSRICIVLTFAMDLIIFSLQAYIEDINISWTILMVCSIMFGMTIYRDSIELYMECVLRELFFSKNRAYFG